MSEQVSVGKAEESAETFSAELTVNYIFNGKKKIFCNVYNVCVYKFNKQ